jgi:predicted NACHT family NTPase
LGSFSGEIGFGDKGISRTHNGHEHECFDELFGQAKTQKKKETLKKKAKTNLRFLFSRLIICFLYPKIKLDAHVEQTKLAK